MTSDEKRLLATKSIRGVELVEEVARLATMNLLLHGIGGNAEDELPIACKDSLKAPPEEQVNVVLTNPPFGIKGSVTYSQGKSAKADDSLTVIRPDFWVQTANKQLNFLQHIVALLKPGGRAAVVVPDNVLFETGAAASIRRRLIESCRVHTVLRLPQGLFYAAGVKSNVIFFERPNDDQPTSAEKVWVYDLRSDKKFSLRTKPLQAEDLRDFVTLFKLSERKPSDHHRTFQTSAVLSDPNCRLDLSWTDPTTPTRAPGLARLDELSQLVAGDLQRALALIARAPGKK